MNAEAFARQLLMHIVLTLLAAYIINRVPELRRLREGA